MPPSFLNSNIICILTQSKLVTSEQEIIIIFCVSSIYLSKYLTSVNWKQICSHKSTLSGTLPDFLYCFPFTTPLPFCLLKKTTVLVLLPQSRTRTGCHSCSLNSSRLLGSTTVSHQDLFLRNLCVVAAFLTGATH